MKSCANKKKAERIKKSEEVKRKSVMTVEANEEYEHIRVEGMTGSGAFDTISPMELVEGNEFRETEVSKNGQCYS